MWQVSEQERLIANTLQLLPDRHYFLRVGTHWYPEVRVVPNVFRHSVSDRAIEDAKALGMAGMRPVTEILAEIAGRLVREEKKASPPPPERA